MGCGASSVPSQAEIATPAANPQHAAAEAAERQRLEKEKVEQQRAAERAKQEAERLAAAEAEKAAAAQRQAEVAAEQHQAEGSSDHLDATDDEKVEPKAGEEEEEEEEEEGSANAEGAADDPQEALPTEKGDAVAAADEGAEAPDQSQGQDQEAQSKEGQEGCEGQEEGGPAAPASGAAELAAEEPGDGEEAGDAGVATGEEEAEEEVRPYEEARDAVAEEAPLPAGWTCEQAPDGTTFYFNERTGEAVFERPTAEAGESPVDGGEASPAAGGGGGEEEEEASRPTPPGWELMEPARGAAFYFNAKTDEATFVQPYVSGGLAAQPDEHKAAHEEAARTKSKKKGKKKGKKKKKSFRRTSAYEASMSRIKQFTDDAVRRSRVQEAYESLHKRRAQQLRMSKWGERHTHVPGSVTNPGAEGSLVEGDAASSKSMKEKVKSFQAVGADAGGNQAALPKRRSRKHGGANKDGAASDNQGGERETKVDAEEAAEGAKPVAEDTKEEAGGEAPAEVEGEPDDVAPAGD